MNQVIMSGVDESGYTDKVNIGELLINVAKAGLIDHISPAKLQFTYLAKQQIYNSLFWWSILSGQLWTSPLFFPVRLL
jgi:hypothetical protein